MPKLSKAQSDRLKNALKVLAEQHVEATAGVDFGLTYYSCHCLPNMPSVFVANGPLADYIKSAIKKFNDLDHYDVEGDWHSDIRTARDNELAELRKIAGLKP